MLANIISDLHIEFSEYAVSAIEKDLVIIAGDIANGKDSRKFVSDLAKTGLQIVIVLGNHEYYQESMQRTKSLWLELSQNFENVYLLDESIVCIGGQRFIGCTLWTDFNAEDKICLKDASKICQDYKHIKYDCDDGVRKLTAQDVLSLHKRQKAYLTSNMQPDDIVVTHHAPSHRSIPYSMQNFPRGYDSSALEYLMLEMRPKLWIHGHIHSSMDYQIGKTRVIANPRGYIGQYENSRFNTNFIVGI